MTQTIKVFVAYWSTMAVCGGYSWMICSTKTKCFQQSWNGGASFQGTLLNQNVHDYSKITALFFLKVENKQSITQTNSTKLILPLSTVYNGFTVEGTVCFSFLLSFPPQGTLASCFLLLYGDIQDFQLCHS
jgi:hypothetical protein